MISILLVDDEPDQLDIARLYLEEQRGFRVECVLSAKEALRMMQETAFDVIVSDYYMPEMNGVEFLKKIRRKNNSIPFILFTARGRKEIVIEALNAGTDFYFQKGGDPDAQFAELSHIIRKVVRQHRAEKALEESEERYRRITEGLTDYLYTVQVRDGRAVSTTHGAACIAVTGYTAEEFAADPFLWIRMVSDDDRERVIRHFSGVLSGTQVPPVEHRIVRKDGQVRWVRDTPVLQLDPTGIVVSYDGVIKDITGRRQAEEALVESETRYREFFTISRDSVFITSPDGQWIDFNDATLELFGYESREEMSEVPVPSIYANPGERSAFLHLIEQAGYVKEYPLRLKKKDGTVIDTTITTVPVRNPDGSLKAFIGTIRDITERKRAEEALSLANRKLGLLSSITRHDINNQMTALQGFVALLERKYDLTNQMTALQGFMTLLERKQPDTSFTEYFQKINAAADRISAMIRFTKEYESIGVHAPVWQDVGSLIDIAVKDVVRLHVQLINDIPAGTEVYADPLISRVFYNLMDNAVRYGKKITTIRFFAEESGDNHLIVCEDDGAGVVAGENEMIFERGFGKNTGLGLALSREILSITGITIRETGEPGKGARFEMTVQKGAYRSGICETVGTEHAKNEI